MKKLKHEAELIKEAIIAGVKYAEERGFTEIWQADTRLARDCIVLMSAFLTHTKTLRIGSGVLPIWTRNPAVIAASWSTMWAAPWTRARDIKAHSYFTLSRSW